MAVKQCMICKEYKTQNLVQEMQWLSINMVCRDCVNKQRDFKITPSIYRSGLQRKIDRTVKRKFTKYSQ